MFMSDELAGVDIINSALTILISTIKDKGFLPFIDYIISINYNVKIHQMIIKIMLIKLIYLMILVHLVYLTN